MSFRNNEDIIADLDLERLYNKILFIMEGKVKLNITANNQIDTGFMRESVYTVTFRKNNYQRAKSKAEGQEPTYEMGPRITLPSNRDGAVVVGANYAIFLEMKKSFLYKALDQVKSEFGNIRLD